MFHLLLFPPVGAGPISSATKSVADRPRWGYGRAKNSWEQASCPTGAWLRMSPRRYLIRAVLVLVAIPPALMALSLLGLFPWSRVNCSEAEIDIASGRIRHTRYLLGTPISQAVVDSALTKALHRVYASSTWPAASTLAR